MSVIIPTNADINGLVNAALQWSRATANRPEGFHWSYNERPDQNPAYRQDGTINAFTPETSDSPGQRSLTSVGQTLLDACIASARHNAAVSHHLYCDTPDVAAIDCPDCRLPDAPPYVYRRINRPFAPARVVKLSHFVAYQACEMAGWEISEARAFLAAIECRASMFLPGYESAPWGISDENELCAP